MLVVYNKDQLEMAPAGYTVLIKDMYWIGAGDTAYGRTDAAGGPIDVILRQCPEHFIKLTSGVDPTFVPIVYCTIWELIDPYHTAYGYITHKIREYRWSEPIRSFLPKCECGSHVTSFPDSHSDYCPLYKKRDYE